MLSVPSAGAAATTDPMSRHADVTVSPIQAYQAVKEYVCPGCDHTIPAGTFHLVVIPDDAVDMRRHWHRGCWHKELRRVHGAQASRR